MQDSLFDARSDQMVSLRNLTRNNVQQYFSSLEKQILNLSQSQAIIDASRDFSGSFKSFSFFVGRKDREGQKQVIREYYKNQISPLFNQLNPKNSFDYNSYINSMSIDAIALQSEYIAKNSYDIGKKENLLATEDGTSYTRSHKKHHPFLRSFVQRFQLRDLILIDSKESNVIYTTKKNIDFGSSLVTGPYNDSAISEAFQKANTLKNNEFSFIDYKPYSAAFGEPVAFLSAPVFDEEGVRLGVLIFQLASSQLTDMLIYNGQWQASGLGETGETYLVNEDGVFRTTSRLLIEDTKQFSGTLYSQGVDEHIINNIQALGTNASLHTIQTPATDAAFNQEAGTLVTQNYMGQEVLSAFESIEIFGHKWALLSEITMQEVMQETITMQKNILFLSIVTVIIIVAVGCFVGFFLSKSISQPILQTSQSLRDIAKGDGDLTRRLNEQRNDELGELASAFNQFVDRVHSLVKDISSSAQNLSSVIISIKEIAESGSATATSQQKQTEKVVMAITDMSSSAQQISENTVKAAQSAEQADSEGQKVQETMREAIYSIECLSSEIDEASEVVHDLEKDVANIVSVLDVISGMAEQTNLLALNAAIESARAGEAGRGFAVVADEVRALAGKTQQSTTEIHEMINRLQKGSLKAVAVMESSKKSGDKSTNIVGNAGNSLLSISEMVSIINEMASQIAKESNQQMAFTQDINKNIVSISRSGETSLDEAKKMAVLSVDLNDLSEKLHKLVSKFQI